MLFFFFFSSRRRHTRLQGDWSSDVCSSDLIEAERDHRAFASVDDLVSRAGVNREEVHRLAEIGAFESLGHERRAALWEAARAIRPRGSLYEREPDPPPPSPLRPMTSGEEVVADYEGTSLSLGPHPML